MREWLKQLSTPKYRWVALVFIALGLAIVIIDNTVLNVSIPYMLRDLHTDIGTIEWVLSGYSLTIATLLITVGRLSDLIGRKKMLIAGIIIFVIGSYISSTATDGTTIIFGRAIIQATGAAIMLTSALSLVAASFSGKERAIAFGVWGSVAGAAASVGPLLGGFLTTYVSWRWSLRINVLVGAIALLGSVFIMESKGKSEKRFDVPGMILSGLGIFSLVFAFIEGHTYGFLAPNRPFSVLGFAWPLTSVSVIPFFFAASVILLAVFIYREYRLEQRGGDPLLSLSMFRNRTFAIGALDLLILTFGQYGMFFILPIFLENVPGYNALQTGLTFLFMSGSLFVFGTLSGFLAQRFPLKWIIVTGQALLVAGIFLFITELSTATTSLSVAPGLILFGTGFGLGASQLNNMMLSAAPEEISGEASGVSVTMRQLGASVGVSVIGLVLTGTLSGGIANQVRTSRTIPASAKSRVISGIRHIDIESGQIGNFTVGLTASTTAAVRKIVKSALTAASRDSVRFGSYFVGAAFLISFLIPRLEEERTGKEVQPPSAE